MVPRVCGALAAVTETEERLMIEEMCRNCGRLVPLKLAWQLLANGYHHLRGSCSVCGKYVKYLPQTEESLQLAGPKPEPPEPSKTLFE